MQFILYLSLQEVVQLKKNDASLLQENTEQFSIFIS